MYRHAVPALGAFGIFVSLAVGHGGPRIWVNVEDGQVTTWTGAYPPGDPADYEPSLVFTQPLTSDGDDIWYSEFPGYQMVPGGGIPAGTTFSYNITGPLLWYNAGDENTCPFFEPVADQFGAAPPVPQMAVMNELFQVSITSTGFVSGDAAFAYHGNPGDHNHLTYLLLGDGVNIGGGPDGIYALPLQLVAPGYTPSETFHLLLGKNASAGELAEAAMLMDMPPASPDLDGDGDVDQADFGLFQVCLGAEVDGPLPVACRPADLNGDCVVDDEDVALFVACMSGAGVPADPACLP